MKNKSLVSSFYHAFCGIFRSLTVERNMFIHFMIMLIVILCGLILNISLIEWLVCIIVFGNVLALELVNTALETTVDICSPNISEKAKTAKDTAAGAVLIMVLVSIVAGLIIFLPKIINFINK